jgi:hypothetical protein
MGPSSRSPLSPFVRVLARKARELGEFAFGSDDDDDGPSPNAPVPTDEFAAKLYRFLGGASSATAGA